MSTRAEELRVHEQRTNGARKRALTPAKGAKPSTRAKAAAPLKAIPRRPVKRKVLSPLRARVG